MEVSGVIVIILALSAFGLFNWLWLKPKRMEKFLRKQGLKGSSYRFFSGDLQEIVKLAIEAKSKPIKLNDDILPRVLLYEHKAVTAYGKNFFTWMGPTPVVHFSEPALVKEILSNVYQFHKPSGGNPLRKLLETGLKHFRLELSPSYSHAPHVYITLEAQHGAHLILHKL